MHIHPLAIAAIASSTGTGIISSSPLVPLPISLLAFLFQATFPLCPVTAAPAPNLVETQSSQGIIQPPKGGDTSIAESQVIGQECSILKVGAHVKMLKSPHRGGNDIAHLPLNSKADKGEEDKLDLGILSCNENGHECMEDSSSSLGGRCVLSASISIGSQENDDVSSEEDSLLFAEHRGITLPISSIRTSRSGGTDLFANFAPNNSQQRGIISSERVLELSQAQDDECSFVDDAFHVQDKYKVAGTSILRCGVGKTCIDDVTSSLGGRCIALNDTLEYVEQIHRRLEPISCHFANGTLGVKCDGDVACKGVTGMIGCGSCIGYKACYDTKGTIGDSSCVGEGSCFSAGKFGTFTVGDSSCIGYGSCHEAGNQGTSAVGNSSCIGDDSCRRLGYYGTSYVGHSSCIGDDSCSDAGYSGKFAVGNSSCIGDSSCEWGGFKYTGESAVGDRSCIGEYSCYEAGYGGIFAVGDNSCIGESSCYEAGYYGTSNVGDNSCSEVKSCYQTGNYGTSNVGDNSCSGVKSCYQAGYHGTFTVGDSSCKGDYSCQSAGFDESSQIIIGDCHCDGDRSCYKTTQTNLGYNKCPTAAPTSSPTSTPTTTPSSSPTFKPTSLRMTNPTSKPMPNPTSSLFWYPNWKGSDQGCIKDGNPPSYMTLFPQGVYLFIKKEDCCNAHFSWKLGNCMGDGVASSGDKWYADWVGLRCVKDGNAPEYMVNNPSLWLYDTQEACCSKVFSYAFTHCTGTAHSATGSGKYFPDWEGKNEGCLIDDGLTRAPQYMQNSPSQWMVTSLSDCCEKYYNFDRPRCMGASGLSSGSEKWYADWTLNKCIKDCNNGANCGGLAQTWDDLYESKGKCCKEKLWWVAKCEE